MAYKATLGGKPLATGTMKEIEVAASGAITDALGEDPEGVAMSAVQARRDFDSGAVETAIASMGEWKCPMWVRGKARTLLVTKED